MTRVKYTNYGVNANGDTLSDLQVEVRDSQGNLATLYEAATGSTEAYSGVNPFNAGDGAPDKVGLFEFFVEPGTYSITVGVGGAATIYPLEAIPATKTLNFGARGDFVTWVTSGVSVVEDGTVAHADGFAYKAQSSATQIEDLPGWVPAGDVYPNHFADNSSPGTTSMSAAFQAALDNHREIRLQSENYLIDDTVLVTENRRCIIGTQDSIIQIGTVDGEGFWLRNPSDPSAPGSLGPSNFRLQDVTLQRVSGTGASVRMTVATGVKFRRVTWWGGAPDVIQEGCRNVAYDDCSNSPTIDYSGDRVKAAFQFIPHVYSDGSVTRGFSTKIRAGQYTSSITDSYRYDSTFFISAADQMQFSDVYFGSSLSDFIVKPEVSGANVGGLRFSDCYFDDGGSAVRYQNNALTLDTTDNAGNISAVTLSDCFVFGQLNSIVVNEGSTASIGSLSLEGATLTSCGRRHINILSANTGTQFDLHISGGSIQGWGAGDDLASAEVGIYVERARDIVLSGLKVNDFGLFGNDFIFVVNQVESLTLGSGLNITNLDGALINEPNRIVNLIQSPFSNINGSPVEALLGEEGYYGIGGTRPAAITDFTAELKVGTYRYREDVATGAPGDGSVFECTAQVMRDGGGGTVVKASRRTTNVSSDRDWIGKRVGATGSFTWRERPTVDRITVPEYTVASLPDPTLGAWHSALVIVTDEVGGAVLAFSDSSNWRRVTDRAIVS